MNTYQKEDFGETEITKKEQLKLDYEKSVQNGYHYLVVAVRDMSVIPDNIEIILNYYANVPDKMEYYLDYYNDDLRLIRNADISIYKWMFA